MAAVNNIVENLDFMEFPLVICPVEIALMMERYARIDGSPRPD
jgi:hypothetical protein